MVDRYDMYAVLSPCETYRYTLSRRWGEGGRVLWVMLNPSTADAFKDDQTVKKCVGFSRRWGYSGIMIVNLFALRSRDPKLLLTHPDPKGPDNVRFVRNAINGAGRIVLAWGGFTSGGRICRMNVEGFVRKSGKVPYCLGRTASGAPKHPVLLGYDTPLEEFRAR